jgi:hypothetical protein
MQNAQFVTTACLFSLATDLGVEKSVKPCENCRSDLFAESLLLLLDFDSSLSSSSMTFKNVKIKPFHIM